MNILETNWACTLTLRSKGQWVPDLAPTKVTEKYPFVSFPSCPKHKKVIMILLLLWISEGQIWPSAVWIVVRSTPGIPPGVAPHVVRTNT